MEFSELVKRRYSVRSYNGKKVEQEKVEKILEAAHAAPTAANLQPVRLLVIRQEEGLKKLAKAANIYHAPLAIVVCADHSKAWVRPFDKKQTCDIDASILTDHMMLQAADLDLAVSGSVISNLMYCGKNSVFQRIWSLSIYLQWVIVTKCLHHRTDMSKPE